MSIKLRILILNVSFMLSSFITLGQDKGGPPPPNKTIDPPVGLEVPIDSSLIYLVVAGIFLGIYFYSKSTKVQKD